MKLTLKIWRQKNFETKGRIVNYEIDNISPDMSFLEMLDVLNERLISLGEEPIAFDHDCREGICGSCSMVINGKPHGPLKGTTTCQLHMYHFNEKDSTFEILRNGKFLHFLPKLPNTLDNILRMYLQCVINNYTL